MVHRTPLGRLLVLFSVMLGLLGSASAVAADASTYQDPDGAYQFTLPDGWQASPPDSRGVAFFNATTGTAFVITTAPAAGLSLDDVTQAASAGFTLEPGYTPDSDGIADVTLGNKPAKALSYHSNGKDGNLLSAGAITVVNNDTFYLLYFLTSPDQENASTADVATIVSSWMFP